MAAEQKDLGDRAMGVGVHATVSVKQPTMIQDPKCSRDTQVENQALHDYVDGLTITMNVIQPRSRKKSKEQAAEMMQDVMPSSHGGQPSSAIHHHRMCYQCEQKGHYAKSCPQKRLPPAPRQAGQQGRPAQPRAP